MKFLQIAVGLVLLIAVIGVVVIVTRPYLNVSDTEYVPSWRQGDLVPAQAECKPADTNLYCQLTDNSRSIGLLVDANNHRILSAAYLNPNATLGELVAAWGTEDILVIPRYQSTYLYWRSKHIAVYVPSNDLTPGSQVSSISYDAVAGSGSSVYTWRGFTTYR